ncbi:hypothetical protein OG870_27870 [Streptomyces sp. NBC_00461]|uniref:hypothetical protein n=1 Tax=Streptomyces sp. NBC_00461 TaxID=2975750 RepID=UPI002E1852A1
MDSGIAAIIGAAIGAVGSAITSGVSGFWARSQMKLQLATQERQAERQARAARFDQIREPRKQVYSEFAKQADALVDQLGIAVQALQSEDFDWEAVAPHLRNDEAVDRLIDSFHAVSLEGPEDINYLSVAVVQHVQGVRMHATAWVLKRNGTPLEEEPQPEVDTVNDLEGARSKLTEFRHAAMLVLRAEGHKSEVEHMRQRARHLLSESEE